MGKQIGRETVIGEIQSQGLLFSREDVDGGNHISLSLPRAVVNSHLSFSSHKPGLQAGMSDGIKIFMLRKSLFA